MFHYNHIGFNVHVRTQKFPRSCTIPLVSFKPPSIPFSIKIFPILFTQNNLPQSYLEFRGMEKIGIFLGKENSTKF